VKLLKRFIFAVLAAPIAMALLSTSSAMAESTALCKADEGTCAAGNQVSHVHETTPVGSKARLLNSINTNRIYHVHEATSVGKKAHLLTSIGTVECDALFLGDGPKEQFLGNFTYTNCKLGGSNCSTTEENGPAAIADSGEGHETAIVTEEGLVYVVCSGFIDCSFDGIGLLGTAKGSLLSVLANGEVVLLGQSVSKEVGGFLCPKTSKLDITTTPLEATYIAEPTESTAELCKEDPGAEESCPLGEGIVVECDTLFLGDATSTLATPLTIKGKFTYSNCNHECVVKEENGPTEIKVEKTATEEASVTGQGLVHVVCSGFIDCSYNGTNLLGTGKGSLVSTQANGEVTLTEQATTKEAGGLLCPKTAKLDITTTPLVKTYISG
jgi:hypothetical protein